MKRPKLILGSVSIVLLLVVCVGVSESLAGASTPRMARGGANWVASWTASPMAPSPAATGFSSSQAVNGLDDQTVRNIVFTSVGGSMVRVRVSNAYGTVPLAVGHSTIAITGLEAEVIPGTVRALTFRGKSSITIGPGAEAMSDPVALTVAPLQDLSISLFLPDPTGPATGHTQAQQNNYVSTAGDFADQASGAAFTTTITSWLFVDDVDVLAPHRVDGAVVALGDSITDGAQSGLNTNARWPNWLARRLDALPGPTLSSVDEGIGGNRITLDSSCFGVSALAREARDVIGQTGVRNVILFEGINDIGYPQLEATLGTNAIGQCFLPANHVSVAQIIAADQQLISTLHAHGIRVFGATLTPYGGSVEYSPSGEAERETLNTWIRTSGAFDGVFDFDRAVRDPYDPQIIDPAYAAIDNIHMNDVGYKALADAINLGVLLRR
jgi:lysophospholipase L1-like esterase